MMTNDVSVSPKRLSFDAHPSDQPVRVGAADVADAHVAEYGS